MKILSVFLLSIFLTIGVNAHALQVSAQNSNHVSFDKIKEHITEVETAIQTMEYIISRVEACGNGNQLYNADTDTCITTTEDDPLIQDHGKLEIDHLACTATNEAQFFDGNTWTCRSY